MQSDLESLSHPFTNSGTFMVSNACVVSMVVSKVFSCGSKVPGPMLLMSGTFVVPSVCVVASHKHACMSGQWPHEENLSACLSSPCG